MYTPFNKRATEYLPDGNAFLSIVTPDFFKAVLAPPAEGGQLFDRLLRLIGTPGSGKTTLAKLLQYENAMVVAARRDTYRSLYDFFVATGFIERGGQSPARLVTRLPMESEYRTFGSLPYDETVRNQLLVTFIQARAVLSWLGEIKRAGIGLDRVAIAARGHSPAVVDAAGANSVGQLRDRAAEVERVLYAIVAGVVPPREDLLPTTALAPYAPFGALDQVIIDGNSLEPLVILDDFHQLSKSQRGFIIRAFTRRELRIARWVMMRYDALSARSVIANDSDVDDEIPQDVDLSRELVTIMMQDDRLRAKFNRIAPKMADQQLQQVSLLWNAGIRNLSEALSDAPPSPRPSVVKELAARNEKFIADNRISGARLDRLLEEIDAYEVSGEPEVRLQALYILMHRLVRRIQQTSLMDELDPEPNRSVAASPEVIEAARVQLFNQSGRPYYYGPKVLTDAASGNAEQYLRLCNPLVSGLEATWIQQRRRELSARSQHERLLELAKRDRESWRFPENVSVAKLVDYIGDIAKKRTLEPTAPVAPGPNAVAILAAEFSRLFREPHFSRLAETLKFAIAYNALILSRSKHKAKDWVVLQLNGLLCIDAGLPLAQGNYVDAPSIEPLAAAVGD